MNDSLPSLLLLLQVSLNVLFSASKNETDDLELEEILFVTILLTINDLLLFKKCVSV